MRFKRQLLSDTFKEKTKHALHYTANTIQSCVRWLLPWPSGIYGQFNNINTSALIKEIQEKNPEQQPATGLENLIKKIDSSNNAQAVSGELFRDLLSFSSMSMIYVAQRPWYDSQQLSNTDNSLFPYIVIALSTYVATTIIATFYKDIYLLTTKERITTFLKKQQQKQTAYPDYDGYLDQQYHYLTQETTPQQDITPTQTKKTNRIKKYYDQTLPKNINWEQFMKEITDDQPPEF